MSGSLFLYGSIGGLLVEVAHWYGLRQSVNLPEYLKKFSYWLITLVMIAAGGFLATIWDFPPDLANWKLLAVNIGASAPLIIKNLSATVPAQGGDRSVGIGQKPSLWTFLRGE